MSEERVEGFNAGETAKFDDSLFPFFLLNSSSSILFRLFLLVRLLTTTPVREEHIPSVFERVNGGLGRTAAVERRRVEGEGEGRSC